MAIWRHSNPMWFLQLGTINNVPSFAFWARVSASIKIWFSRFIPLLTFCIMSIAHFICLNPIKLVTCLFCIIVSKVGTIYSSKMLIISGKLIIKPFVWFKIKFNKSRRTHLAFWPGFRFHIVGTFCESDFLCELWLLCSIKIIVKAMFWIRSYKT